jgi:hypothetical protein
VLLVQSEHGGLARVPRRWRGKPWNHPAMPGNILLVRDDGGIGGVPI